MNKTISTAGKPATLCHLRRMVAQIEGQDTDLSFDACTSTLGVPVIDRVLQGGLTKASLHEVAAAAWPDLGAAFGFTFALAARVAGRRHVLWIQTDFAALEGGAIYGP
ncbi:MAG: hypothetical protein JO237_00485, partial [Pseudolabrys sp.]|nr:hypothetical protein [Pseudolabrys sp.]